MTRQWLTTADVARHLNVTETTVRRWCFREQVPGAVKSRCRCGETTEWRIPAEALDVLERDGPLPDPHPELRQKKKEKDAGDGANGKGGG